MILKEEYVSIGQIQKKFDRILYPMYSVNTSCFSIDFFRALDTTRIFVWAHKLNDEIEKNLVQEFPKKYCTNRIGGDITTAIEAIGTINKREFSE